MKTNFYYTLFILCLFSACRNNGNRALTNENGFPVQTVKWKTQKDFLIKDIVRDIRYIMLEDSENSMFTAIDKLIVKGDRIYLLDITGPKSLLVFDISGKFLHRVGRQGGGPGEYAHSVINFDVLDNDAVLLYDYVKRNMMFYDKNGMYLKSVKSAFSFNDFIMLPDCTVRLKTVFPLTQKSIITCRMAALFFACMKLNNI